MGKHSSCSAVAGRTMPARIFVFHYGTNCLFLQVTRQTEILHPSNKIQSVNKNVNKSKGKKPIEH